MTAFFIIYKIHYVIPLPMLLSKAKFLRPEYCQYCILVLLLISLQLPLTHSMFLLLFE